MTYTGCRYGFFIIFQMLATNAPMGILSLLKHMNITERCIGGFAYDGHLCCINMYDVGGSA